MQRIRRLTATGAVTVLAVVGASCGGEDRTEPEGPSTTAPATTATASPPADAEAAVEVEVEAVDTGLDVASPMVVVAVPGTTSLLVAEREGRIVEVVPDDDGGPVLSDRTVIDLSERVGSTESERGLLGLAIAPDGDHLYASYTRADDGASLVDEFDLVGEPGSLSADEASRRNLVEVDQPFGNHNGGHVEFGPDGMLYLGLGDGGAADDPSGSAQDPTTLLGKLVRLDPFIEPPVPADNPFVGDDELGALDEIWATGLRNPWRFGFDADTGDLWVADVGQNRVEEINLVTAAEGGGRGANFGWDLFEGTEEFEDPDPAPGAASDGPFVEPVFTYGRDQGCSVTGGVVYRGTELVGLEGAYLYSDFCAQGVRALVADDAGGFRSIEVTTSPSGIVGFGQDAEGEVLVLSLEEGVFRLAAR